MSVAKALSDRTLELRKARDEIAPGFLTVQGFAQASAKERGLKGGDAAISDEDALRAVMKGIKMCRDTLALSDEGSGAAIAFNERISRELKELEALLPQMATDDEVKNAAATFLSTYDEKNMKLMGPTMTYLNGLYGTSLDKAKASGIIKQLIND